MKFPFHPKLFQGWLMRPWYLSDDSSGEDPDGGDDGGTGSDTEPGPAQPDDDDNSIVATNAEELAAALADDDVTDIVLSSNITDAVGLSVTSGDKTIDLNGHSITAASDLDEDNWGLKLLVELSLLQVMAL